MNLRKNFYLSLFFGLSFSSTFLFACAQSKKLQVDTDPSLPIAFPGAEGFGRYTSGGRGGSVVIVSNLNDNGPGSLREAVNTAKPKIVVFAVSGTIHLETPLSIKANTTLAGQTAPGDGICIADQPVSLAGNNIIVRYMRFRMGDKYQNKGMVDGSGHDDAFSAYKRNNIIVDHCSASWSNDEVMSVYGGDSVTLQWNVLSEPLNYSYHFETGDKDYENHGYGGIWGGKSLSAHHNLFAHCLSRNPRFNGIRNYPEEFVDFRNNVIYDWGHNNVYGGEGGNYNIVNNYYKPGPATVKNVKARLVNPSRIENKIPFGKYYVSGNFIEGAPEVNNDNRLGVHMGNGTEEDKNTALLKAPFPSFEIPVHSPQQAYEAVLQHGGCSLPSRDTLDERILREVRTGTGRVIDVQGGFPHGTPYEKTVSAWPSLRSLPAPKDSDADGMPDAWEKKQGLNPSDASDASGNKLHRQYTNIEVYINSLISTKY